MMENMKEKLKNMLDEERYVHSLGVQETAVKLAAKYGADTGKASTAGLIHDCAKRLGNDELLKMAKYCDIDIGIVYQKQPELLHGPVGAYVAEKEFLIYDKEILHAIKYHTTGCENMSLMDKVIYIADYIEPSRNFPGVDDLREETYRDLDSGVLMALDNTIRYVIVKKQLIDILTIRARNYMLYSMCSRV